MGQQATRREQRISALRDDWAGVVVGHDVLRTNHEVVAGLDDLAQRQTDGIPLYDLLDDGLRYDGTLVVCPSREIPTRICETASWLYASIDVPAKG